MTHSQRSERGLVLSVLLIAAPLLLGVRSCERVNVGEECENARCPGGGSTGAGAGGASGDGSSNGGIGGGNAGTGGASGASGTGAGGTGVSGTGAGGAGTGGGGGDGCEYGGEQYEVGDTFPDLDGCNTCTCTEAGPACTLIGCESVCGGIAGLACGAGEYCNYAPDALCGAADALGTCAAIPDACDLNYAPVCGCDGETYGNACAAALEGVSVASEGECHGGGGSGQTCGGIASLECSSAGEFCNYEESAGGQGCDGTISDAAGVCQTTPEVCPAIYAPVCGCDRRTYSSDCNAHGAGQSVLHEGACTEIDCEAIGGHAVDGTGPGPMCPAGEREHGSIRYSNGMIAIEGTICCVP
jgi:hypothetical protein